MNILYIHGLNSTANSRTATVMQQCLGNSYKVYAPAIPKQPDEALSVVKNAIHQYKIDLVIGSSLGGFIALKLRNVMKIVINPCCNPGLELQKLGEPEIATRYEQLQKSLWTNIDAEEREITFGLFGTHDELFSYLPEFQKHYNYVKKMSDGHRISPMNIKNVLCPLIKEIEQKHLPELAKKVGGTVKVNESEQTPPHKDLFESYVNALTQDDMQKYAHEVWDILEKSYAYCGGLLGMKDVQQLISESDMWKMVRRSGKIVCVVVYSFKRGGRKMCYGGTDGTPQGKSDFYKIMSEDINMLDRKAWAEVSEKMEYLYLKNGAVPIPNTIAKQIMSDKEFVSLDPDGYHYIRSIGGILATKMMVGNFTGTSL